MKYLSLSIILMACTGCMNQARIDRALAELPPYMRENIGPVKYQPLSPLSLILAGQVIETDPTATIYLYALADEEVLKHEAFHSFELLAMHNRPMDWQDYYMCMGNTDLSLPAHLALLSPFPPQWIPSKSSASLYGETNHFEDGAEVFVHHQPERKWDCVCRFANGIRQDRSYLTENIAEAKPTGTTTLSNIQHNFSEMTSPSQRQENVEEKTTSPTIFSKIQKKFHEMASLSHRQETAEEKSTGSTTFSKIQKKFHEMASTSHRQETAQEKPTDSTILYSMRRNFYQMASIPDRQEDIKRKPAGSTVLSKIQQNFNESASSSQQQPTDSTILSTIRQNFQEMTSSRQQQENAEK